MSGAAARQAQRRLRDALGLVVLRVEVNETDLVSALLSAGFISVDDATSRKACEQALARVVQVWTREILVTFVTEPLVAP